MSSEYERALGSRRRRNAIARKLHEGRIGEYRQRVIQSKKRKKDRTRTQILEETLPYLSEDFGE